MTNIDETFSFIKINRYRRLISITSQKKSKIQSRVGGIIFNKERQILKVVLSNIKKFYFGKEMIKEESEIGGILEKLKKEDSLKFGLESFSLEVASSYS